MSRLYFALGLATAVAFLSVLITFYYSAQKNREFSIYREAYYLKAYQLAEDPGVKEQFRERALIPPEGANAVVKGMYAVRRAVRQLFPEISQQTIVNEEWGTVEIQRCTTCHAAIENPMFEGGVSFADFNQFTPEEQRLLEKALVAHPDISPHKFTEISCTSCHAGNGRGLTLADAHGFGEAKNYLLGQAYKDERFERWLDPVFMGDELRVKKYYQALCVSCHPYPYVEGQGVLSMDQVKLGRELFFARGCYSCHKIDGLSWGQIGPELTKIGEQFRWEYIELSLWNPAANQADTKMPFLFSTPEVEEEILRERHEGIYPYEYNEGLDPRRDPWAAREVYAIVTFLLSQRPSQWVVRTRPGEGRESLMGPPEDRPNVDELEQIVRYLSGVGDRDENGKKTASSPVSKASSAEEGRVMDNDQ